MNLKYPVINGKKECGSCHKLKPLIQFSRHKNHFRSYCKECNQKTTKIHRDNNPILWNEYSKSHYNKPGVKQRKFVNANQRLIRTKELAVAYKGGKCKICGYNNCITALEFHHLNPKEKDRDLKSRGINRRKAFEKLKPELDKCILVCCRCHREIHAKIIIL
jgi:hypothetical protein